MNNRLILLFILFSVLLYSCDKMEQGNTNTKDKPIRNDERVLTGEEVANFIKNNSATSNEYMTIDAAHEKFKLGLVVTDDALKTLSPYLKKETSTERQYFILLIENEGISIGGWVIVDKNSNKISKSEFIGEKYLKP